MATNPSNSNAININALPQAQLAVEGDLLILQTSNGTQTIDFQNFNVVKTDLFDNASITGNLTAKDAVFAGLQVVSLTAGSVNTSTGQGTNASNDFYDRFTIEDGIVLSASSNTFQNPVYTEIMGTQIPVITSYMLSLFSRVADETGAALIDTGYAETGIFPLVNFFQKYNWIEINDLKLNFGNYFIFKADPASFSYKDEAIQGLRVAAAAIYGIPGAAGSAASIQATLTGLVDIIPALSSIPVQPYILPQEINRVNDNLEMKIRLPYTAKEPVNVYYRVLVTG